MRFSRTDLVPMLAIIGGGAASVLISGSLLLWSPSDDVPAPGHRVAPSMRVPASPAISPDGQWIAFQSHASGEPWIYVRGLHEVTDPPEVLPLVYVDGVRVETSFIESLNPDDIERIEVVKGEAAVALHGEEASSGVIQISLKEARHRR